MMIRSISSFVLLVSCIASTVNASLPPPPPLLQIHHPRSLPSIDILPKPPTARSPAFGSAVVSDRTLRRRLELVGRRSPGSLKHDDSMRVRIEVDGEEFALHMKPNHHLLHPSFSSHSTDHPLHPTNVLAYEGHVLPLSLSPSRLLEDLAGGIARSDDEEFHAGSLGWARLLMHDTERSLFEGAFMVRGETYTVLKASTYEKVKDPQDPRVEVGRGDGLVVFRDRDVRKQEGGVKSCSHDELEFNTNEFHPVYQQKVLEAERRSKPWWVGEGSGIGGDLSSSGLKVGREDWEELVKRDDVAGGASGGNFSATIGQTAGCPTSHKLIYMGVAADCAYTAAYGGPDAARMAILNNWNTASALYKSTFNVSLGIVELFVQPESCPSPVDSAVRWNTDCSSLTLNDRLSAFSSWRGAARSTDQAGLWALMSGCASGQEVGVAWLGQLCVKGATDQGSQGVVSGTSVSTNSRSEWQVVAHEIGHNVGAQHDCSQGCPSSVACCPLSTTTCDANGAFLMSPVSQAGESNFSPCTVGNVCSSWGSRLVDTSCLADPGSVTLISLQQCGNGIVEPGEDCDPGANGSSSCCDPTTCKFRTGAVCDPSSSACCNDSCSFASAGTVCRASLGSCDLEETCPGTSSTCPPDSTVSDGTSCGSNGLECASGVCTSRDLQCSTVGASLGITRSCSSASNSATCSMTCQSATGGSGSCVVLQSTFVDGTPCGFGGRCDNGQCATGSALNTAKSWYLSNLNISIPVTVVVGIIFLLILMAITRCIVRCCYRKKDRRPLQQQSPPSMATLYSGNNYRSSPRASAQSNAPLVAPSYDYGQQFPPPPPTRNIPPPPRSHPRQPSRGDWVDPTTYNGQNHNEASWR